MPFLTGVLRPGVLAALSLLLAACRPTLPTPGLRELPPPPPRCTPAAGAQPLRPVVPEPGQGTEPVARPQGTTAAAMGYFERLPPGYAADTARRYPLVIFLHGAFETGHYLAKLDGSAVPGVRQHDLTALIDPRRGGDTPFLVLYPQRCSYVPAPGELREFIDYAMAAYRVDPRRIYLVGHSAGAGTLWLALPQLADRVAAAVSLSAVDVGADLCPARDVPVWAFHGADDPAVPLAHSRELVRRINACSPPPRQPARLTVLERAGHDIDTQVLQAHPPAAPGGEETDVLRWLLQHTR
ncbi:hypothetical protein [Ideonella sp. BN130291]|uniref:carboxylesterase family protein n=1 Tax=Ideonella sp. BN130291 TaxID=3112940 RepID=UPI002E26F3C1|nr:hypothetical protein [Ideonella sp. BN130291]